jgi:hypothetical protein
MRSRKSLVPPVCSYFQEISNPLLDSTQQIGKIVFARLQLQPVEDIYGIFCRLAVEGTKSLLTLLEESTLANSKMSSTVPHSVSST